MSRFTTSITLSGLGMLHGPRLDGLVESVVAAEAAGIDQVVITDHLAIGPRTDRYPYGPFPFPPEEPWPEPLTALAVMAGATRRIRLGTGVLIAPLRPALLLAKTLSTLDVLSGGRIDVGVGTGWQREEFEANGVPFEGRGARLDDVLGACRAIWTDSPASFTSPSVQFEDLYCEPRPLQPGGPPLWFGMALGPKTIDRITRFGSGWMPILSDAESLARGVETLRAAFEAAGRAPDELGVRGAPKPVTGKSGRGDLDATLDSIEPLLEAGATQISLAVAAFVRAAGDLPGFFERFAERASG
jgi:probable F420-dependent oxidoreductase